MQINNYSYNQSFNGMTKVLKSKILTMPYKEAERLISGCTGKYWHVGYFPDDILKILKQKSISPEDLNRRIKIFNRTFSDYALRIQKTDEIIFNKVKNVDLENYIYKAIIKYAQKYENYPVGYVSEGIKFYRQPEDMTKILNDGNFEKIMKQIGVIPTDGKIKFDFAGNGTYKDCFKVSFYDKDKQIIHSKAFNIEKDPDIGIKCNNLMLNRISEYRRRSNIYWCVLFQGIQ